MTAVMANGIQGDENHVSIQKGLSFVLVSASSWPPSASPPLLTTETGEGGQGRLL